MKDSRETLGNYFQQQLQQNWCIPDTYQPPDSMDGDILIEMDNNVGRRANKI